MSEWNQLCVWEGCVVGEEDIEKFERLMKSDFDVRIKYHTEVKTNPDLNEDGSPVEGTGGRNDLFFYIHDDDISKFAVKRLMYGIRWWEDVLGNGNEHLYSKEFLKANPKTW